MIEYTPFRKSFFEDKAVIPGLCNTKMSYEFDAYYKKIPEYWKKGPTFSSVKRTTQVTPSIEYHGPTKPAEYPKLCELPVQHFGRVRRTRPPVLIRTSPDRSLRRTHLLKEATRKSLVALPQDDWEVKPICGVIRPSPCFVPPTNRSQTARPYPSRPLFPEVDRIEIDILETESYNEQHPCVHHQTSCTSSQNRSGTRTMTSGSIDSSSPLQGGCWSRSIRPVSEVDSVPSDLQQLIVSSRSLQNLPCPEIVSSPKTKETQRRMDYYNTLISPLLDETMERQWRIPVMKSTTGKEKRRKESAKRLHKIYTSGMHRVITLKTAENVAMVSAPSSSSLSSGSNRISAEDMMYLERVLGSSERARELIQVSTERSSHLLDQILETS